MTSGGSSNNLNTTLNILLNRVAYFKVKTLKDALQSKTGVTNCQEVYQKKQRQKGKFQKQAVISFNCGINFKYAQRN